MNPSKTQKTVKTPNSMKKIYFFIASNYIQQHTIQRQHQQIDSVSSKPQTVPFFLQTGFIFMPVSLPWIETQVTFLVEVSLADISTGLQMLTDGYVAFLCVLKNPWEPAFMSDSLQYRDEKRSITTFQSIAASERKRSVAWVTFSITMVATWKFIVKWWVIFSRQKKKK